MITIPITITITSTTIIITTLIIIIIDIMFDISSFSFQGICGRLEHVAHARRRSKFGLGLFD